MKIKKLELCGFKSFMNKTTISFTEGVTAIVGPNGCGKSNIADAILWVLGEQSSKELRGRSMEDVIFYGTADHPSVSFAEISMTFTKEGVVLAPHFDKYPELMITRRLYRSGESEYYINKIPCRLKDISELFMDTGIGSHSYSFIKQGRVEELTNMKPEERRFIIEEAAGITKYKSRRREAERKMESTNQNLLRISDILAEKQKQLNSLKRQADKANRYKRFREKIRNIELYLKKQENQKLSEDIERISRELTEKNDEILSLTSDIEAHDSKLVEQKRILLETENKVKEADKLLYEISSIIQKNESQISMSRQEIEMLEGSEERITEELAQLEEKIERTRNDVEELERVKTTLSAELEETETKLTELETVTTDLDRELRSIEHKMGTDQKEMLHCISENSRLHNNINYLENRRDEVDNKIFNLDMQMKTELDSLREIETEQFSVRSKLDDKEKELGEIEGRIQGNEALTTELNTEKEKLESNLVSSKEKLTDLQTVHYGLELLEKKHEGFKSGIKSILESYDEQDAAGEKPRLVVDSIRVDEKMEGAISSLLEDRLQGLLTENRDKVFHYVDYLQSKNTGPASFLLPSESTGASSHLPGEFASRTMGAVCDFVSFTDAPKHENAIRNLFERAYVVSDLNTAIDLHRANPDFDFITPSGEKVDRSGIISVGSTSDPKMNILERRREMERLKAEIETTRKENTRLETEIRSLSEKISTTEEERKVLQADSETCKNSRNEILRELDTVHFEIKRLNEKKSVLEMDKFNFEKEISGLEKDLENSRARLEENQSLKQQLDDRLDSSKKESYDLKQQLDEKNADFTQVKIRKAQITEKLENTYNYYNTKNAEIGEMDTRITHLKNELENTIATRNSDKDKIAGLERELEENIEKKKGAEENVDSLQQQYSTEHDRISDIEDSLKNIRENRDACKETMSSIQIRQTETNMKQTGLKEKIFEKYQVDVSLFEHEEDFIKGYKKETEPELLEAMELDFETISRKLEKMGEVNMAALSEYQETKENFDFIVSQQSDLQDTLKNLQQTIDKIDRESRTLFMNTFTTVNNFFKKIFPAMFNGGRAELVMTNPTNWLESGIEIIAQPPGKKLQSLNHLSGGEKAMTSVSLIFALFQNKPSPFCLLDEVDAPLDDSNIDKYNQIIRKMSTGTQFIIVTHNKRTMEVGDTLYGVTMEKKGISKIVSVKVA